MIALKRILVATDFCEAADAALAYGRELAHTFGATLHVLHVADDVYVRLGGDAYVVILPQLQQELERCPVLTVRHPEHDFVTPDLPARRAAVNHPEDWLS